MVDGAEEVLRSSGFKCELEEPVFSVAQWIGGSLKTAPISTKSRFGDTLPFSPPGAQGKYQ